MSDIRINNTPASDLPESGQIWLVVSAMEKLMFGFSIYGHYGKHYTATFLKPWWENEEYKTIIGESYNDNPCLAILLAAKSALEVEMNETCPYCGAKCRQQGTIQYEDKRRTYNYFNYGSSVELDGEFVDRKITCFQRQVDQLQARLKEAEGLLTKLREAINSNDVKLQVQDIGVEMQLGGIFHKLSELFNLERSDAP